MDKKFNYNINIGGISCAISLLLIIAAAILIIVSCCCLSLLAIDPSTIALVSPCMI